jgi:hypothetical protein
MRNAVELDEFLASCSDEEFERLQSGATPGFRDQLKAAAEEGRRMEEGALGKRARWVDRTALNDWVRLGMYDALCVWFSGKARTCMHQPTPESPEPVFSAAWKPGLIVCARCTDLLVVTGDANMTCDGCGHLCQGMPDDGIKPVTTFVGALGYQVGVCTRCDDELPRGDEL